jgi:hypothetical protein
MAGVEDHGIRASEQERGRAMRLAGRGRSGPGRVTAPEAAARTGQAGNAWALPDIRVRDDEWRAGHVPGAVPPPLTALAGGDGSVA